ncbi:hypothetical protein CQA67_33205, partial [Klebsiella pneumoniae]
IGANLPLAKVGNRWRWCGGLSPSIEPTRNDGLDVLSKVGGFIGANLPLAKVGNRWRWCGGLSPSIEPTRNDGLD